MNILRGALENLDRFFEARSRNAILLISLVAAFLVGALDYFGAPGVLILYLGPTALAAWYGKKRVGAVVAIYCATAWYLQATLFVHRSEFDLGQLISFFARLAMFLVLSHVIARLREAMRQQKELVEFIIHDLRSPISSAITGLETIKESPSITDPTDREMIDLSTISCQRALTLVSSLLDVAKLESGKFEIHKQDVAIHDFLGTCVDQIALWAGSEKIRIDLDVQQEQGIFDPELTSRVVVNLLSNALKFSPPETTIKVRVVCDQDRRLRFSITDQGPGIPAEFVATIFDPFSQVKGTKGGTGLGLTFCRLAIQAQHGKIWAESVLGRGTTMTFTIQEELTPETA